MKLQVTNREIAYAVNRCWEILPLHFKYQVHNLYNLNDAPSYEQEVEVDEEVFRIITLEVSSVPQGIAKDINPILQAKLLSQIQVIATPIFTQIAILENELAQLTDEQEINTKQSQIDLYKEQNKEVINIRNYAFNMLAQNEAKLEAIITSGYERLRG